MTIKYVEKIANPAKGAKEINEGHLLMLGDVLQEGTSLRVSEKEKQSGKYLDTIKDLLRECKSYEEGFLQSEEEQVWLSGPEGQEFLQNEGVKVAGTSVGKAFFASPDGQVFLKSPEGLAFLSLPRFRRVGPPV